MRHILSLVKVLPANVVGILPDEWLQQLTVKILKDSCSVDCLWMSHLSICTSMLKHTVSTRCGQCITLLVLLECRQYRGWIQCQELDVQSNAIKDNNPAIKTNFVKITPLFFNVFLDTVRSVSVIFLRLSIVRAINCEYNHSYSLLLS